MAKVDTTWSRREISLPNSDITKIYLSQYTGGDASGGDFNATYIFDDDEIKNYDFWLVHFDFITSNFTVGKLCYIVLPSYVTGSFGPTPYFPITLSNIDNALKGISADTFMNQKPLFIGHKFTVGAQISITIAWNQNQAVDSYDSFLEFVRKPIVKS